MDDVISKVMSMNLYECKASIGFHYILSDNDEKARGYVTGYNCAVRHTAPFSTKGYVIVRLINLSNNKIIWEESGNAAKEET